MTERAALGFRVHAGWVAVVCLAGSAGSPAVIERKRLLLTANPLPFEPYHRAKGRGLAEAEAIVRAAADEARNLATVGISAIIDATNAKGYKIVAINVVLGSGRPDFTLQQALSTHAAMHNAEGWLNREGVMNASRDLGLHVVGVLERDVYAQASGAFGLPEAELRERIAALGAPIGPPWTIDQKLATLVAWLALVSKRGHLTTMH